MVVAGGSVAGAVAGGVVAVVGAAGGLEEPILEVDSFSCRGVSRYISAASLSSAAVSYCQVIYLSIHLQRNLGAGLGD